MTTKAEKPKRTRHTSRASFACYRCKNAKRRCDISQQPEPVTSCSTCRERDEKCHFRGLGEDKRKQRQGTKALQARLALLERGLGMLASRDEPDAGGGPVDQSQESHSQAMRSSFSKPRPSVDSNSGPMAVENTEGEISGADSAVQPHSSPGAASSPYSSLSQPALGIEGSNAYVPSRGSVPLSTDDVISPGGLEESEYGDERYFGASSMFPYGDTQSSSPHYHSDVAHQIAQKEVLSPSSLQDFIEPEPIVSHLLDLFWTYQASHLLIVDRDIFLRHRELARKGDGVGDRNYYTPCLLYAILALASLISTDKGMKRYSAGGGIAGDIFNRRARVLFEIEMECPVITTAQTALLVGSRYGTFVDSSLGWTFSGIALRIVTKLGLHLDCSRMVASNRMTEEEARYRSIAFWGSYIEDRLYSAYCQRPMMLMDWDITISPPPNQELNSPYISRHLLPHTVSLSQICGRTLLGLYAQRHLHNANNGLKKMASEIHGQLWEWQQKLPADLVWSTERPAPTPPSVLVLHMQFYYNLILVHRPLLEFSKVREELSQARTSTQMNSTTTCAIAAANIANLVRDYREQYDIRQITSNTVHITYIAATIHLINFRLTSCNSHSLLFWGCVKALRELADSYPMAQKAVHILNNLVERFGPLSPMRPGENAGEQSSDPATETNSTLPTPTVGVIAQTNTQSQSLSWVPDAYCGLSFGLDGPLEIPQSMDVEGLIDAAGTMDFLHPTRNDNPVDPGDWHSFNYPSVTAYTDGDLSLLSKGQDHVGSISPNMRDRDRDLFDAFYGKAVGLY